jgi:hypothetical protein
MFLNKAIFSHGGAFGDLFVITGAINYYSNSFEELIVPVREYTLETAKVLFRENKKITLEVANTWEERDYLIEKTGYESFAIHHLYNMKNFARAVDPTTQELLECSRVPLFDEQTYTLLDLPFSVRYSHFNWPDVYEEASELYDRVVEDEYILVHNEILGAWRNRVSHDIHVPNPNGYQEIQLSPALCSNPLYYYKLIKNAKEIHCVPSSMFCLVDSIASTLDAELYYHDTRKPVLRVNNRWNNWKWNKIDYKVDFVLQTR